MALDSQDPRTYYFRALCLLRMGRAAEARGDMIVGAALEAQRPKRYAVGTALERVQGHDRLTLEQFRRQARLDAAPSGPVTNQVIQAQSLPDRDADVLRQRVVIPLDQFLEAGVPTPLSDAVAAPSETPRTFVEPPSPEPTVPMPPSATDDPFRDDSQPEAAGPPKLAPPVIDDSIEVAAPEPGPEPEETEATPPALPPAETQPESEIPNDAPAGDDDPFDLF
jgi:hypothetical protein